MGSVLEEDEKVLHSQEAYPPKPLRDFYIIPKDFMSDWDKECIIDFTDSIEAGAPRGEMLDSMDFNEMMLYTLNDIIEDSGRNEL